MPRILILNFSHLCRNTWVMKEATTFGAAGNDVTGMPGSTPAPFERMDLERISATGSAKGITEELWPRERPKKSSSTTALLLNSW